MALLALLAARSAQAQLTDTVAIGVPYPLGDSGSVWQLAFTPAGSKTAFDRCPFGPPCRSQFTPDIPGEYIATLGNASIHLQAVDLRRWSRGEVPIMADTFGALHPESRKHVLDASAHARGLDQPGADPSDPASPDQVDDLGCDDSASPRPHRAPRALLPVSIAVHVAIASHIHCYAQMARDHGAPAA